MPYYSVVIKLKDHTKTEIENKLRGTFGGNLVDDVIISEGTLIGSYDACVSNNHFGCVHWTEEDLQSKFSELGITITPEILEAVQSSYLLRHIDDRMIEQGWEVIEEAIRDAISFPE